MKFKRAIKKVYRKDSGETYIFKNGLAKIPGVKFKGKPMMITLKEFDELTNKSTQRKNHYEM